MKAGKRRYSGNSPRWWHGVISQCHGTGAVFSYIGSEADPEVFAKGGELRYTKIVGSEEGPYPFPENFLNFKSKNVHICTLLYTDF